MRAACPDLFALPVKHNHGLPLGVRRWRVSLRRSASKARVAVTRVLRPAEPSSHAEANHLDIDRALRLRRDLREVVRENLDALRSRKVLDWLDLEQIWSHHPSGRIEAGKALMLLNGLEVNPLRG